ITMMFGCDINPRLLSIAVSFKRYPNMPSYFLSTLPENCMTLVIKTGILIEQDGIRVFKENYAFKSPSAAAAVINGRHSNGTTAWKVKDKNMTYKEWEAEKLSNMRG
ncbi:MAG: DUF4357 domain-containing protein, partial [bacterium]|nr:DUF4357 domain-containing protein [bacterium]